MTRSAFSLPAAAVAAALGLALALLTACTDPDDEPVDQRDDDFMTGGKSDGLGVVEGSAEACAVLGLVNQASPGERFPVAPQASVNIDAYVLGPDSLWQTADDEPVETLAELDAIPFVGPFAFGKLLAYALVHYPCGDAPPQPGDDDPATCAILRAANESTVDQLDEGAGLDRRAATAIAAAQPIATLAALDALPYVGTAALAHLADYAAAEGLTCAAACAGTGGSFDGVGFTRDEECHAIDFANHARLSQMATLDGTARHFVYDCAMLDGRIACADGRRRAWTRLAELDLVLGGSRMAQVKAGAASWVDDGRAADTIAATWADRDALLGLPVGFDKVFVARRTNPSSATRFCYELRDAPDAANFLTACVWLTSSDAAPPCSFASCMDPLVGSYVALRGTLKPESFAGGVGVTVYPGARPTAPRE